jgi:hypothetical protein
MGASAIPAPFFFLQGQLVVSPPSLLAARPTLQFTNLAFTLTGTITAVNATVRFSYDGNYALGQLSIPPMSIILQGSSYADVTLSGMTMSISGPITNTGSENWGAYQNAVLNLNVYNQTGPAYVFAADGGSRVRVKNPLNFSSIRIPKIRSYGRCCWVSSYFEYEMDLTSDDVTLDTYGAIANVVPGTTATFGKLTLGYTRSYIYGNGSTYVTGTLTKTSADWTYLYALHKLYLSGSSTWDGHLQIDSGSGLDTFSFIHRYLV